ncbi:hypothetical protein RQP46_001233 [Phenoliferia psychrophenolica]
MLLTIGCGFFLTKKGLFPPAASKGYAQVSMNCGLPALLFSSMVSSFNQQNISNFGPLCMVALLCQALGLSIAVVIRELFYVPAEFQWGILLLGMISNWGNLPTAIVQSVATESPFDPATDPSLGIAYIAIFILIMSLSFYGTGLYRICAWDYLDGLEPTPPTLRLRLARKEDERRDVDDQDVVAEMKTGDPEKGSAALKPTFSRIQRMESSHAEIESLAFDSPKTNREKTEGSGNSSPETLVATDVERHDSAPAPPRHLLFLRGLRNALSGLVTPITLGVLISLPISLIDPLKALFVSVDGWTGSKMPNAPDGQPPLSFFYDFTTFIGAITIPGGLIILGASFARINITRARLREMPIAAMLAMAFGKMFVSPAIGISIVNSFRNHTTLFPKDEKNVALLVQSSALTAVSLYLIT